MGGQFPRLPKKDGMALSRSGAVDGGWLHGGNDSHIQSCRLSSHPAEEKISAGQLRELGIREGISLRGARAAD